MMTGGYHVLEEVASRRHEMLGSVLSVWTHAGLSGQHNAHVMWSRVMMLKLPVEETKCRYLDTFEAPCRAQTG